MMRSKRPSPSSPLRLSPSAASTCCRQHRWNRNQIKTTPPRFLLTSSTNDLLSARAAEGRCRWRQLRLTLFVLALPGTVTSTEYVVEQNSELSFSTTTGKTAVQRSVHNFFTIAVTPLHDILESDEDADDLKEDRLWEAEEFSTAESTVKESQLEQDSPHHHNIGRGRRLHSSDSDSDSRDRDKEDDYWRNPDYWDDYVASRDDDFYKYIGDPAPPSLSPLTRRDIIGFMFASLGAVLGSAGGIGGGGLVVPCYIIAVGLPPRYAMPLGSVTVLGGSLAALMLNCRRRHPLADRPVIDWDLILVMEPLVLIGSLFGTVLHRVVSEKIITVLLVLLLSVVAHTTLAKAKRMSEAERRYIEHLKSARSDYMSRNQSFRTAFRMTDAGWSADALEGTVGTLGDPTLVTENKSATNSDMPSSPIRTQSFESRSTWNATVSPRNMDMHERQRILILNPDFVTIRSDLMEQEKVTPGSKIMALVGKFSVLMFLNITLGGGAFASPWGIECGGIAFWIIHVIMVAFLISSAWAARTYLVNRHELKEIVRFDYVHGDIKWEPRTAIIYPCFFILAGLSAGMFGVGGGMITVPLMLAMGVHPAICTATSATMVFFTALLSASSFAVFNLILWDYAIVCMPLGFIASLIGQGIMQKARQTNTGATNFERNSLIAYCIGCVIMLCALLMTLQYVLQIVFFDDEYSHEGGLCEGYRI